MKEFLRDVDLFAVPVSLKYRGKSKFGTQVGGCLSLLIILLFSVYSGYTLYEMIVNPALQNNTIQQYFSNSDNTDVYNITTLNSTIAINVKSRGGKYNTNQYLRVVFLQFSKDDDPLTKEINSTQLIPTIDCTEFFDKEINENAKQTFFDDAFSNGT